jgi:hypothetical protein
MHEDKATTAPSFVRPSPPQLRVARQLGSRVSFAASRNLLSPWRGVFALSILSTRIHYVGPALRKEQPPSEFGVADFRLLLSMLPFSDTDLDESAEDRKQLEVQNVVSCRAVHIASFSFSPSSHAMIDSRLANPRWSIC